MANQALSRPKGLLTRNALLEAVKHAQELARQWYIQYPRLLESLLNTYSLIEKHIFQRQKALQDILDKGILAEHIVVQAWNRHRLGIVRPEWHNMQRQRAGPAQVGSSNASHDITLTGQDRPDVINYNPYDDIPDVDEAYPARAALLRYGILFHDPQTIQDGLNNGGVFHNEAGVDGMAANVFQGQAPPQKHATSSKPSIYGKLGNAPHRNTLFPNGNITATEILVFFPEWLKSLDVIDRFVSNGVSPSTLAFIINTFRVMLNGDINGNTVYSTMKCAMEHCKDPRFQNWTVRRHQARPDHDASSISVAGFRIPGVSHPRVGNAAETLNRPQPPINFRDIADNVVGMPEGSDALDLTRCIQYACTHRNENWVFPSDFERLVNYLGGPGYVTNDHLDAAVFLRWDDRRRKSAGNAENRTAKGAKTRKRGSTPRSESTDSEDEAFESIHTLQNMDRSGKRRKTAVGDQRLDQPPEPTCHQQAFGGYHNELVLNNIWPQQQPLQQQFAPQHGYVGYDPHMATNAGSWQPEHPPGDNGGFYQDQHLLPFGHNPLGAQEIPIDPAILDPNFTVPRVPANPSPDPGQDSLTNPTMFNIQEGSDAFEGLKEWLNKGNGYEAVDLPENMDPGTISDEEFQRSLDAILGAH
ncbi:hypothetical protein P154DRAFT_531280 [Amniculicola lignicola CBS 123094]|uniref:Uncharacterized protein n=1 Tax=Amniculicola lignicola CBS 123094 TaxID=1392246 RepID=A0A6A5WX30_9PLEO|nr:hypothetical protein P154DRAFT_531280 [Amniculicola lignicola CBS 123094]